MKWAALRAGLRAERWVAQMAAQAASGRIECGRCGSKTEQSEAIRSEILPGNISIRCLVHVSIYTLSTAATARLPVTKLGYVCSDK